MPRGLGDDHVVAGAAVEDVGATVADEDVVAGATGEGVVAGAADQHVVAIAAVLDEIDDAGVQPGGGDHVVTGDGVDRQRVVGRFSVEQVHGGGAPGDRRAVAGAGDAEDVVVR